MVINESFPTPTNFGLIFIDCWENPQRGRFTTAMQSLQQLTNCSESFNEVPKFFATYQYSADHIDRSLNNTIQILAENTDCGTMVDYAQDLMKNSVGVDQQVTPKRLSSELVDYLDQASFLVHSAHIFEKIRKVVAAEVQDWIILGGAWQHCYHFRDMGLHSLKRNYAGTPMRFYSPRVGVFGNDETVVRDSYEADTLTWLDNGEIYKLLVDGEH